MVRNSDSVMTKKNLTQENVLGYYKAIIASGVLSGYETQKYNTYICTSVGEFSVAPEIPFNDAVGCINSVLQELSNGKATLESISLSLCIPEEGKERFISNIQEANKEGELYSVEMKLHIDAERIGTKYKFDVSCYGLPEKYHYTDGIGRGGRIIRRVFNTKRFKAEKRMYNLWLNEVKRYVHEILPIQTTKKA